MTKPSLVDKIRSTGIVGLTSASLALATTGVVHAQATDQGIQGGLNDANVGDNSVQLPALIKNIINIILYIVGVAAVVMMIIGGIRYIVSGGDQQAVTNAKNTILYSIVGLVIAMLAFVVVQYVFNQVSGTAAAV